jgi:hypothetical protein
MGHPNPLTTGVNARFVDLEPARQTPPFGSLLNRRRDTAPEKAGSVSSATTRRT